MTRFHLNPAALVPPREDLGPLGRVSAAARRAYFQTQMDEEQAARYLREHPADHQRLARAVQKRIRKALAKRNA